MILVSLSSNQFYRQKINMNKLSTIFLIMIAFALSSQAQIKVSSAAGSFDTLTSGTLIYYQYAWDDPLDEDYPAGVQLPKPVKAFEIVWDSMLVSDGAIFLTSTSNPSALLAVDAVGWDLIDKGYEDTINYPNISPVTVSLSETEVEWMDFGFYNEIDKLYLAPSKGSVKISVDSTNKVNIIYGDFAIVNPDLCFEGFGSLRPSVTYFDNSSNVTTWFIYGDPTAPTIDTLSDTAFANLPPLGQKITIDFNKTNWIKQLAKISISVSPNPAMDIITVNGSKNFSGNVYQLISMDGKMIIRGKMVSNKINVSQLKTGNYILKITDKGQGYYSRFIKSDN